MFPNLAASALAALHVPAAGSEPVQYRTRGASSLYAGKVTPGAWGSWTDLPRPYVVDHLQTGSRSVAQDGDRIVGRLNLYCLQLANGLGSIPIGKGDQIRLVTSDRTYVVDDVSDWDERAGFARYACARLDQEV